MIKKPVDEDYGFKPFDKYEDDEDDDIDLSSDEKDEFGFDPYDKEEDLGEQSDESEDKEEKEEEPSFWQSVASHPVTQAVLGAAKRYTFPLDVLKFFMLGEGLSGLDEIEENFQKMNIPFDREEYINNVYKAASLIPTQQLAEDLVKEHTGVDLEPKDTFSKIVRTGTEIAAGGPFKELTKQPLKQAAKQITKRTVSGLGGAATGEAAKWAGVPEPIADVLAGLLGGAGAGKKEPFKLKGQQAKNAAIAEKHNLRKFGGLQREEPLANAVTAKEPTLLNPATLKTAKHDLDVSSKKAIDEIINSKIPATKLQKMGVNLDKAYTKVYKIVEKQAKQLDSTGAKFDTTPLLNNIKKRIKEIKKTAPSLSPSDKSEIRELTKQYKQLTTQPPTPAAKPHTPIYGPNGQVLNPAYPAPKAPPRKAKTVNAEKLLDQYRNFNEETRGIYRKTEFSGSEEVVKNAYAKMKEDLIGVIEKTDPELANNLKTANKLFHESSKLDQINGIIEKSFVDGYNPKKLNQILGSKRNRAFLERDLGKGAVKDMQEIAKYGMEAEKSVLKAIKNPKTLGEMASELTPLKASLLFLKGTAGIPVVLAHDIPKAISSRIKGRLMLSPKTRQSYADFIKQAVSPESPAFKRSSRNLTKSIEDEYGSEQEFLKSLESEDDEDEED